MSPNLSPSGLKPKWAILLSINAAAIIIAGVLISSAIWLNGGVEFRVVDERSDIIEDKDGQMALLEAATNNAPKQIINYEESIAGYTYTSPVGAGDASEIPSGEIWNETSITIYATPDVDICIGSGLADIGSTYWQTSNTEVIAGFYDSARTWLGYDSDTCRYPAVKGTGSTNVTVGTYDGKRKDTIVVNVISPPAEQWKREVLSLINNIRANNGLSQLTWGKYCEGAADLRANEIKTYYSHTRPDGTDWSSACPIPESGGLSGENLAVGNAAVSPVTVVMLWMYSDTHRANILNPDYTKLAVGFNFDPDSKYRTHWSQFFSTY